MMINIMAITRIVSGGQTGADRGGLEAAALCCVPHGGWCPQGRYAEDGDMPDYYTLTEMTTRDELACAEANVVDSDATIVFSADAPAGVPLRTLEFAAKHGKPWFRACLSAQGHKKLVQDILAWLRGDPRGRACMDQESCPPKECILYVAGSRESESLEIQYTVEEIMVDVITKINEIDYDAQADDRQIYHPSTMKEAVGIVLDLISDKTRDRILAYEHRSACLMDEHYGFGIWLRDAMVYENVNLRSLAADIYKHPFKPGKPMGVTPYMIGTRILGYIWEVLHGESRS